MTKTRDTLRLRPLVGILVLTSFVLAYLGTLMVNGQSFVLAVPAFFLTVLAGMAQQRRARDRGAPQATTDVEPTPLLRTAVILAGTTVALSLGLLVLLAWNWGAPEIGELPLLASRERYLFNDHGIYREAARWRFVVVGLAFHTAWTTLACSGAVGVFFREARSTTGDDP